MRNNQRFNENFLNEDLNKRFRKLQTVDSKVNIYVK